MTTDSAVDLLLHSARAHALGDVLRRSALRWPRKTAIVYGEISRTYAQLDEAVSRTANALRERGVRSSDRVAVLSHNNYAYAVVFLALARLGAISVPINFMLNADEVRFILEHSGAIGMVVERALTSVADEAIRATGRALRVQGVILEPGETTPDHWENVEHWMAHSDSASIDVCVERR